MNDLIHFDYQENPVRVIRDETGEPWWVARDICGILGYPESKDAIRILDDDEKGAQKMPTLGGEQSLSVISESGLYTLIIRSNKPEAKPFRRWVTHDVLPAIRQNGHYSITGEDLDDEEVHPVTASRVPVSVAMLSDAAQGIKAAMIIARAMGYRNEQARVIASQLVKEITGLDVMELMNLPKDDEQRRLPLASDQPPPDGLDEDVLADFVEERCTVEPGAMVEKTALYRAFLDWNGERLEDWRTPPGQKRFSRFAGKFFRTGKTFPGRDVFVGIGLNGLNQEDGMEGLVRQFLENRCKIEQGAQVYATPLYECFVDWFRSEGTGDPPSQSAFGRRVSAIFRKRSASGYIVYLGLRIKEEDHPPIFED